MEIKMNDEKLQSPEEIKAFLQGTQMVSFSIDKDKKYAWIG